MREWRSALWWGVPILACAHCLLACSSSWTTYTGAPMEFAPLASAVTEYQDPSKADKISAIQKELDETTAVLVRCER